MGRRRGRRRRLQAKPGSIGLLTAETFVDDAALAAGVNDNAASYALRLLRTAGLVQRRREAA